MRPDLEQRSLKLVTLDGVVVRTALIVAYPASVLIGTRPTASLGALPLGNLDTAHHANRGSLSVSNVRAVGATEDRTLLKLGRSSVQRFATFATSTVRRSLVHKHSGRLEYL